MGVEHHDGGGGQQRRHHGHHDARVARQPVPHVVGAHALLVRQPQPRAVAAAALGLGHHQAVQTGAGHDGVAHQREVDEGEARHHLGVGRLRRDLGDLAVAPEQAVQVLLRQLGGRAGAAAGRRYELDAHAVLGEAVQVLEPRHAAHQAGLHGAERVEPRLDGLLAQHLRKLPLDLAGRHPRPGG